MSKQNTLTQAYKGVDRKMKGNRTTTKVTPNTHVLVDCPFTTSDSVAVSFTAPSVTPASKADSYNKLQKTITQSFKSEFEKEMIESKKKTASVSTMLLYLLMKTFVTIHHVLTGILYD